MDQMEHYHFLASQLYQERNKFTGNIYYVDFNYSKLKEYKNKTKNRKDFSLISIEKIDSEIPSIIFENSIKDVTTEKEIKKELENLNRTGSFLISFKVKDLEENFIFISFLNTINEQINLVCSSSRLFEKFKYYQSKQYSRQYKPNLGVYTAIVDDANIIHYQNYTNNISKKVVYHKIKKDILEDVKFFFKNIDKTIENGEKGTRKLLIAGVQGTGKSSFLNEIMLDFKSTHSICICTDLKSLVKHTQLCGKYSVPCISILEDCENHLDDRDSNFLNYLSGTLEPSNKAGSLTFFTTNYPQKLSDRIKHRPERIDEVYILSFLDEEDAMQVAKYYFGRFLSEKFDYTTLKGLFLNKTGAEIMKLADDVKKEANFKLQNFEKINRNFIEKVMFLQKDKFTKLSQINTAKTETAKTGNGFGKDIGFSRNFESIIYEDYDDE